MSLASKLRSRIVEEIDLRLGPAPMDMVSAGLVSADLALLRSELLAEHHVRKRSFVAAMLPKGAVGAELGVFTGLFATVLLKVARPSKMYLVDPWWKAHGAYYSDWGRYNDFGRLKTRVAHRASGRRARKFAHGAIVELRVEASTEFLASIPDHHLDWVYLDTTHTYEGTKAEADLLRRKLKPGGLLAGDDWFEEPNHVHEGVARAMKEAIARGEFELLSKLNARQWAVRTPR